MDEQGIMALGQGMQAPTAQPAAGLPPELLMAFDQARGTLTSEQVSNDSIAALQEADPNMAAQLTEMLRGMNLPAEVIDVLGQLVDYILAYPDEYEDIKEDILSDPQAADAFGDLLPPVFDPAFFAGLNIALDRLAANIAPSMAPQGFAGGGIADLSPVAAGIARMGRNGDTMLAHVTPSEARLLRMRGGAGTINPVTGLPEYLSLKSIGKSITGAVKSVGNAIGGAVKSVVKGVGSLVKSVASSTVGRLVLTAAAFMIGGPMLASYLGTSALVGGSIAVGLANTGMALASGAKFGDALKQGAIAGATTYAGGKLLGGFGQQAPAPIEGAAVYDPTTGLTTPGAFGMSPSSVVPDVAAAATQGLTTPSAVSATQPGAIDLVGAPSAPPPSLPPATSTTALGSGIGSGIGPATPPVAPGVDYSLMPQGATPSYMSTPTQYSAFTPTPGGMGAAGGAPAPTSAFGELAQAGKNIVSGNYMDALGNVGSATFGTPLRAGATILGGTMLAGGFTPKQPEPPGLIPSETGYDLLRENPEVYGTAPGGAQTVYAPEIPYMGYNPIEGSFQIPRFQVRPPEIPRFAAMGGEISRFAEGGIASLPQGAQQISVYYDPTQNRYLMSNPAAAAPAGKLGGGIGGMIRRVIASIRAKQNPQAAYLPFDPGMFTSGMSPQQYLESQKQAQQAAAARPFFTPGGAQVVPIQQNLAGTAATALPMLAGGGMPEKFPRRNGQISGPGTEKSDDIPAMLSDGEFVMTAKAVRGAGGGSRREGAKRMYQMMHQLERMA